MGEAKVKKSLLALPPFQFFGSPAVIKNYLPIGTELFKTVVNDLETSSLFQLIDQNAFLEESSSTGLTPSPGNPGGFQFKNWSAIGTEFLIRAGFTILKDKLIFDTYVYYVPQAKLIFAKKYESTPSQLRLIAHTFCNQVIKELTGTEGMFTSRVVVSSDRGGNQWKEIYILDWDGYNIESVTQHKSIAISPTWSNSGKKIAYTAYAYHTQSKVRNADLFLYDLETKQRHLLSSRPGINSGAAFLPDDSALLLTISQKGNPDIFKLSLDGRLISSITNGPQGAMNVEPAVTSDGQKIAFSSDRSGKPMIYIMNSDGTQPKRVTFAGHYNSTPTWSPDGKKLAFAGFDNEHFDIFIMDSSGYNLERLTTAKKMSKNKMSNNEDPVFSPDGRHIMFVSDRTGNKQLYLINIDGTNERRLTFDRFNYFKPKWSKNR